MPNFVYQYLERTPEDGYGAASAEFTVRAQRSTRTLLIQNGPSGAGPLQPLDISVGVMQDFFEFVDMTPGDGRVRRTIPTADPIWPWLYASRIGGWRGVGQAAQVNANPQLEVPALPQTAFYPNYLIDVEYTPRPYAVVSNDLIQLQKSSWTATDGSTQPTIIAREYDRYTDFWLEPQFNAVTAKNGQAFFADTTTLASGGPDNLKTPFDGSIRQFLPDQVLKYVWYMVPYRYVSSANSYLQRYIGFVNQFNFDQWLSGQLLFLSYKPTRYTPAMPLTVPWNDGLFSTEKLCDIEFTFLLTNRFTTTAQTSGLSGNFIATGHNLQPWFVDRKFHFTVQKNQVSGTITAFWPSVDFGILFTDPDTPQPGTI